MSTPEALPAAQQPITPPSATPAPRRCPCSSSMEPTLRPKTPKDTRPWKSPGSTKNRASSSGLPIGSASGPGDERDERLGRGLPGSDSTGLAREPIKCRFAYRLHGDRPSCRQQRSLEYQRKETAPVWLTSPLKC